MNRILSAAFFASLSLVAIDVIGQNTGVVPASPQTTYSESASYSPRVFPEAKDKKQKDKPKVEPTLLPGAGAARKETLTIPVGVFATKANAKLTLDPSDFKVFIDDKEVEIVSVESRNEPLNVILLMDLSPSTYMMLDVVKLAHRLVEKLGQNDQVMVAGFSKDLKIYSELTSDRALIKKAIDRLKGGDGTSLYDSIAEVFDKGLTSAPGATVLILVTDGVDTVSRKSTFQESLLSAEKTNAVIIPVYFDTSKLHAQQAKTISDLLQSRGINLIGRPGALGGPRPEEYERGRSYLTDLVLLSGGRPVRGDELAPGKMKSLDNIPSEMKARYDLTFRLPTGNKSGDRHRIKVRVNKPELTILAKGSYIEQ